MSQDKDALDFAGFPEAGVAANQRDKQNAPKSATESVEPKKKSTNTPGTGTPAAAAKAEGSSVASTFWVVVVLLGLVILVYALYEEGSGSSSQTSRAPVSKPSTAPQVNRSLEFIKPPVGTNNLFSVAQIRWCLREDIRIEALRSGLTTNQEVSAFNSMVNDYNLRCASFRYESGTIERAKREVGGIRAQIVAAARQEWKKAPSAAASPSSPGRAASPPSGGQSAGYSNATREVQNLLVQLGYTPGPVDGLYGRRTREAILAFQRDRGMQEEGEISASLRMRLMDDVRRGCDFKRTMTDADYRRCGNTPPSQR